MMNNARDHARRAVQSSALAPIIRSAIAESALCKAATAGIHWLRRTRKGSVAGLAGKWSGQQAIRTSQQLDDLAADSRVIVGLSSLLRAPSVAWREARVKHVLDPILEVNILERIRILGCVTISAVMAHSALLFVMGVPVHSVGWGIRAGLLAAGVFLVRQPEPVAAAWQARIARSENAGR
jgi:hypothetical protein